MIRSATRDDIPAIVDMAKTFWDSTVYEEPLNPETVNMLCHSCIKDNLMCVLDVDGPKGFGCASKIPLLANHEVMAGSELAWWIDPEYRNAGRGVELLKMLEAMAKRAGIKYFTMVYMQSSMPDVVEKIYQDMGYNRHEVSYMKVL